MKLGKPTKGLTIELEFTCEELREGFSFWLDRHAFEMFQDWLDGNKIEIRYDTETHKGLFVDAELLQEWQLTDEAYQEKVESEEINE